MNHDRYAYVSADKTRVWVGCRLWWTRCASTGLVCAWCDDVQTLVQQQQQQQQQAIVETPGMTRRWRRSPSAAASSLDASSSLSPLTRTNWYGSYIPPFYLTLRPNSTTSICCGFVGQQVVLQQAVQHLDVLGCCGLVPWNFLWFCCRLSMCVDLSYSLLHDVLYNEYTTHRSKRSLGLKTLAHLRKIK